MSSSRRFWLGMAIIIVVAIVIRFTGYNYGLPYIDEIDAPDFYNHVLYIRGMYNKPLLPGYPPGVLGIVGLSQLISEQVKQRPATENMAETIQVARIFTIMIGLASVIVVGLLAKQLSNSWGGWLAALGFTMAKPLVLYSQSIHPEPWIIFASILSLYFAARGITSRWSGWTVLSIIAGLIAVIFKYSAAPVLAASVVVTFWRLWCSRTQPAERNRFLQALIAQGVLTLFTASWLLLIYGGQNASNVETKAFFQSGVTKLLDLAQGFELLSRGIGHLGIRQLTFTIAVIGALLILIRRRRFIQLAGWLIVLIYAVVFTYLIMTYNVGPSTITRYLLPASSAFIIVMASALAIIGDWIDQWLGKWRAGAILVIGYGLAWLGPVSSSA